MYLNGVPVKWTLPSPPQSSVQTRVVPAPYRAVFEETLATPERAAVPAGHVVAKGETLTRIVRDHLKSLGMQPSNQDIYAGVRSVAQGNGLSNPDLIYPGQKLSLEALGAHAPTVAPVAVAVHSETLPPAPMAPLIERTVLAPPVRSAAIVRVNPSPAMSGEGGPIHQVAREVNANARTFSELRASIHPSTDLKSLIERLAAKREAPLPTPASTGPWKSTVEGPARLTSNYGMRPDPFTGRLSFHDGIDLAAASGSKVYAFRDGTVTHSGWKSGYGQVVILKHEDGLESLYGHASETLVRAGQKVSAGTELATVGSTGRSTGPHLHFEVRRHGKPVNPVPYLTDQNAQIARNR